MRTCEIFRAEGLVVGSSEILKDPVFLTLAVSRYFFFSFLFFSFLFFSFFFFCYVV